MILIIGAGLGGLSLARTLHKHNTPFRIFEQAPGTRLQGFGLTLHEHTIHRLMDMLEMDEPTLRREVSVNRETGWLPNHLCDALTGEAHDRPNAASLPNAQLRDFRTNRERLWAAIQGNLRIEFNYRLIGIQQSEGCPVAEFANGEKVKGDLLVASDGVHSFVRSTLFPEIVPKDWKGVFFNGIRKVTKEEFNNDFSPFIDDGFAVKPGFYDNSVLAVTVYDVDPKDGAVFISWAYSRRTIGEGEEDPLFVPYSAGKDLWRAGPTPWSELEALPPLAQPWSNIFQHGALRQDRLIRQQLLGHLIPLRTLKTTLRNQKVAFIGDAAHAYSNHAGTAGNEAILDGIALGEHIVKDESVEALYEQRYSQWENAISHNRRVFEAMHKPREEWLRHAASG